MRFASSLDADSEGEEGKFYVWDAAEIDRLLGPDAHAFRLAYGVTDTGNWEGKTILNRLHQLALGTPEQEAALRSSADVLLAARAQRVRPGRDDKVLADWNGLTIGALARASAVFQRPAWLERAEAAFAFVCRNMASGDRLAHSWRAGRRLELAFLDDYAQMAAAALALFEHTATPEYLQRATEWIARLDADYLDPAGGYYQVAAAATDVLVRPKNAQDGPTPAGNGTLVGVLARLHALTGEDQYRTRAEQVVEAFSGEARRNPAVHAALLSSYGLLADPVQVVVMGATDDPALTHLRRTALGAPAPDLIVLTVPPGAGLAANHPAAGKELIDGRATAYVCVGRTCLPPVTTSRPAGGDPEPRASARPALTGARRRRARISADTTFRPLADTASWPRSLVCSDLRLAIDPTNSSLSSENASQGGSYDGCVRVHEVGGPEVLRFEEIEVGSTGSRPGPDPADGGRTELHRRLLPQRPLPAASAAVRAGLGGARAWSRRSARACARSQVGQRVAYAGPLGAYAERRLMPGRPAGRCPTASATSRPLR